MNGLNSINTLDQEALAKWKIKKIKNNGLEMKLMANSRKQGEKYEREVVLKRHFPL